MCKSLCLLCSWGNRVNACVRKCASNSDCLIPGDVTNVDAPNRYVQHYCNFALDDSTNPVQDGVSNNLVLTPSNSVVRGPSSLMCQCILDSDCKNSEVCVSNQCQCRNGEQCGAGRRCIWYGRTYNEFGNNDYYREPRPLGQCQCNPETGRLGCSGRGYCLVPQNHIGCNRCTNQYAFIQPEGRGTSLTVCICLNGFTGKYCETDDAIDQQCSGNGTPLCKASRAKDVNVIATSLNTGNQIRFDAGTPLYLCDVGKLVLPPEKSPDRRGDLGCQCKPGWGPEVANPGTPKCSQKIDCQTLESNGKLAGFVAGDGKCKCINDYYDRSVTPTFLFQIPTLLQTEQNESCNTHIKRI